MKNFVQNIHSITVLAAADVASGAFVLVGSLSGVAQADASAGDDVQIVPSGAFTLPKTSAQAWSVGDPVYWDSDNAVMTSTGTDNTLVGAALEAAANPSGTGVVLLDGAIRA